MNWFEVDKAGLAKLLSRKGKQFVLFELIQNAIDERTTRVDVKLERIPGTRDVHLIVEDDSPDGFADLSHAFTLFAESKKKSDATKRGRFNLGEKLVLALCSTASIRSTTGGVRFDDTGRRAIRDKRAAGSVFAGTLKMTNDEIDDCIAAVQRLIPPDGVDVFFNTQQVATREAIKRVEVALPTEVADDEGNMRRTTRKTIVEFFEPLPGEVATLYELGIPVVETGDAYHVNVLQKVPLNLDRDNVTPAYLSKIRALAVEHLEYRLTQADATSVWVRDAIEQHGDDLPVATIDTLMDLRFGDKRVAADPSDPEANSRAVAAGFTVVHGSQLSAAEWAAAKRTNTITPAGRVFPTYSPYSENGTPATYVPEDEWTPGMRLLASQVGVIATATIDRTVTVRFETGRMTSPFGANYGGGVLTFNRDRLGKRWFERGLTVDVLDLVIHELAHETEANHLSDRFADACTRIGARLARLVAISPTVRGWIDQ